MVDAQRSRVGVDVKALVDKVLGRYATDFGTLRELIQNADDAGATSVAIEFVCEGGEVTDVLVRNDGRVFTTKKPLEVLTVRALEGRERPILRAAEDLAELLFRAAHGFALTHLELFPNVPPPLCPPYP